MENNRTFVSSELTDKEWKEVKKNKNKIINDHPKFKQVCEYKQKKSEHFFFNKNYLKLDAFGYGFFNNAVHITFSSRNIDEARFVYDTFSVFTSIIGALSASSAILDSVLTGWDMRYRMNEQSSDSRSKREFVSY